MTVTFPFSTDAHETQLNRLAQHFYQESGLSLNGTDKPQVVDGLRAVLTKLAGDYTVQLGEERFTASQWETVRAYAKGYAMSVVHDEGLDMQEGVRTFHRAFGHTAPDHIQPMPEEEVPLVIELIREEFVDELIPALHAGDMVETVDALIDILYVTFGALVRMGVDAGPLFREVQESNMSKLGEDGKPIISRGVALDGVFEGRVMKGLNYFKPDLARVLDNMIRAEQPTSVEDATCA